MFRVVPGRRHEAARSPHRSRQHLRHPGVRQPAGQHHVGTFGQITGIAGGTGADQRRVRRNGSIRARDPVQLLGGFGADCGRRGADAICHGIRIRILDANRSAPLLRILHAFRDGSSLRSLAVARRRADTLPPLPRLALDTYPAAAREAISRAHRTLPSEPRTPKPSARSAACSMPGSNGTAPIRRTRAPRRSRRARSSGRTWTQSCCSVSRGHAEAVPQLREALAVSPDYLPARVKLAEALFEAGDLDESQRLFEALVREPAAEPAAEFGLGRIAAAKGLHDGAIAHLQRAVALFPGVGRRALRARALLPCAWRRTRRSARWAAREIRAALARAGGSGPRRRYRAQGGCAGDAPAGA